MMKPSRISQFRHAGGGGGAGPRGRRSWFRSGPFAGLVWCSTAPPLLSILHDTAEPGTTPPGGSASGAPARCLRTLQLGVRRVRELCEFPRDEKCHLLADVDRMVTDALDVP